MSRFVSLLIFLAGVLAGISFSFASPSVAREGCLARYTVLPGDTLSEIAAQVGTSTQHLARINNVTNPNWIWAGQVLCVPQIDVAQHSRLDLVAEYTFAGDADREALSWTFGEDLLAAKRLSYLIAGGDSIKTYADPAAVRQIGATVPPMLWLIRLRNEEEDDRSKYILVVIGDPAPLLNLQIEARPTQQITDIVPAPDPQRLTQRMCPETRQAVKKLARNPQTDVRLSAEIVASEGLSIPLLIDSIDYHASLQHAESCYDKVALALSAPADPETSGYRLDLVLTTSGPGPPGDAWRQRCAQWQGGGWWSQMRRALYGCPRS